MRTEREIREKLEEWLYKALPKTRGDSELEQEHACSIIDALLWVIGDESGGPI